VRHLARVAALLAAALLISTPVAWAEDSDTLRGYLHLKFRDTDNRTGVHDYYGFGLGANLNRYFGLELSGDRFEIFPKVRGIGTIGEYGVFALMPQLRVRYPLFGDRLVPYVIGGGGIGLTGFNDRKPDAFGLPVQAESTTPVATLGGGVEYFIADNIAFTAEFKYLFAGRQTLKVAGADHTVNASNPLASVGLRVFYPELKPPPPLDPREPAPLRLYFEGRIGFALPTETDVGSGIELRPVPPAIGGVLAQYFGVGFGLDIGRYLGVEFGAEGYEVALAVRGIGTVSEYAFYGFIPRLRLRYPLGKDRWVPYAVAGVGLGYTEVNDRKPHGDGLGIGATSTAVAATAGMGLDYFITNNIAIGLQTKYLYSPGHHIAITPGHSTDATLQAFVASVGIRVYLWDFH
jgi:opacity protein-like surface antigen